MGGYEYTADEDYTGQTLDFIIKKEGFIKKNISSEIDRLEIKSDILMNEIEIKIKGKIYDETNNPLSNAIINFTIAKSTIDLVSDKEGNFSFNIGKQFLDQSIGYKVSKKGFEEKGGKMKLIEELQDIHLSEDTSPEPDKPWIKIVVASIVLISLSVLAIYIFALPSAPELSMDPGPVIFHFKPTTEDQTILISNKGHGTLKWEVSSDRDWIVVSPESGTDSGPVTVSVNSDGMSPGSYTGNVIIESNGGTTMGSIFLTIPPYIGDELPDIDDELPDIDDEIIPDIDDEIRGSVEIMSFTADPYQIFIGEESILRWEVSGVNSVTIEPGIGKKGLTGEENVSPDENTTYILTATNEAGISYVRNVTVTVIKHMPKLSTNPDPLDNLNYGTMNEGNTDSRTFSILNNGSGTLEWSISTDKPWITVSSTSGTDSGEVNVAVNTEGLELENYNGTITIDSNGGEPKQVNIYLIVSSEQPTVGSISVTSTPSGANIYLDGSPEGATSKIISGVSVGSHTITITKSGYKDYTKQVTVKAGETTFVNANLVEETGSISVRSSPSGANVYLDCSPEGATSKIISGVSVGSHTITITKSGYKDYTKQVTVKAGETTFVNANLVEETGSISVRSSPSGANVYLDCSPEGATSKIISGVSVGSHTITITKSGYKDYTKQVTVKAGETTFVNANLVEKTGSISVRSSPPGAYVHLDGLNKGATFLASKYYSSDSIIDRDLVAIDRDLVAIDRDLVAIDRDLAIKKTMVIYSSPKIIKGISIGSHTIKITKSGYQDYTKQVNVRDGETTYVSVILTPIPIRTLNPYVKEAIPIEKELFIKN